MDQSLETKARVQSLFIGLKAQNIEFYKNLIQKVIDSHSEARNHHNSSNPIIAQQKECQKICKATQSQVQAVITQICIKIKEMTPPFYSNKFFGHMKGDCSIPALVGSFIGTLYNLNNCAFQGSPFSTLAQIQVIQKFAQLFQYPHALKAKTSLEQNCHYSWGHLTCGGSIANCEALWAARNCKFLVFSLKLFVQQLPNSFNLTKQIQIQTKGNTIKKLIELNAWQILNISTHNSLQLFENVFRTINSQQGQKKISYGKFQKSIQKHSVGKLGLIQTYHKIKQSFKSQITIKTPKIFVAATGHYSIKKSVSILGIGDNAIQWIPLDNNYRMNTIILKQKLQQCLLTNIPVLAVVAIVGSTSQGAVDNIVQINRIRSQFAQKGLYFHFHIDAAFGGYFTSMTKCKTTNQQNSFSEYVHNQLTSFKFADSIIVDPHKNGLIPFACGCILYKDHRLRNNISFSAPYIYMGVQPNVSIYGIEGSKTGSSAIALYASLKLLPLNRNGHGELLQRMMANSKLFYLNLVYNLKYVQTNQTIGNQINHSNKCKFQCILLNEPPKLSLQITNKYSLYSYFKNRNNSDLSYYKYSKQVGSDLNVICYGLNFANNYSLKRFNTLNKRIISLCKPTIQNTNIKNKNLILSQMQLSKKMYGKQVFDNFLKRANLTNDINIQQQQDQSIYLIRSTIMNPFLDTLTKNQQIQTIQALQNFNKQLIKTAYVALKQLNFQQITSQCYD